MVACGTCSLGHPGCSCQSPGPAAQQRPCHQSQARGRGTHPPGPAAMGSCLSILQFGSHSTDVWGRPPLPLPLLLSAWPIPARVSAVPTGEGGGLFQSSGPSPAEDHSAQPGEQHPRPPAGSVAPRLWGPSLCPKSLADSEGSSRRARLLVWPGSLLLCRLAFSQGGLATPQCPRCAPWPGCSGSQPPDLGLSHPHEASPAHLTLSTASPSLLSSMQRQDFKPEPLPHPAQSLNPCGPGPCCQRPAGAGRPVWPQPLFPPVARHPGPVLTHGCSGPRQGGCG